MKILFCVYRDWALRIASTFMADRSQDSVGIVRTPQEMEARVREADWDVLVLIGWSWKVPGHICNSCLVIGMHPSDLPQFAGGSPIQNQILAGLTRTKATLFKLNEEFDKGEIIDKEEFSLEGHLDEVLEEIGRAAYALVKRFIERFPDNAYTPQPPGEGSVVKRLKPEDSRLPALRRQITGSHGEVVTGPPLTCRELWDFIRCREDPYPNAYFEDETGRLVIRRVEFCPKQ
jgi:methionyl-tRNA formyltransferase